MASPSSSVSEGEIFEVPPKANLTKNLGEEPAVDQPYRALGLDGATDDTTSYNRGRDLSRSPSPFRHDRSPSPYRRRRDDRSPSPFRHRRDNRVRDAQQPDAYKRKASPHRDERPEKRYNSGKDSYPGQGRSHPSKYHDAREVSRRTGSDRARDNGIGRDHGRRMSYSEHEHPPAIPQFNEVPVKPANGNRIKVSKNGDHGIEFRRGAPDTMSVAKTGMLPGPGDISDQQQKDAESAKEEHDYDLGTLAIQDEVPSQETREEKRRRWAAKRAQYESTSSNLRQQAILANASETNTPNVGSPAVSTPPGSPTFSDPDSAPATPDVLDVGKMNTLSASPPADGPSAAHYDPTQDMLEDRLRAERLAQQSGLSATDYDETDPKALSTLPGDRIEAAENAQPAKKKKKEIDMFASDDEEDDASGSEDGDSNNSTKGNVLDVKLLDNWDDPDGYYKIISNELVNAERYRMVKQLGRGVFANVAQAEDVSTVESKKLVAIKIVRRNDAMRKASMKEIEFLQRANDADPQDKKHIIRLFGSFDHKGHLCIVFEHMSKNLRDLLKDDTSDRGLSLQAVKMYARQMFSGLKHLQDCQIIHADLKPDNILVSMDKKTIKLCDLGTATDKRDNTDPTPYLVSRFYRSPEIILGMEIGYGIDMWAIGCTIYELWAGKILFPGRSNNQMVKVIMECMGFPSEKLLKKGDLSYRHFERGPPLKFLSQEIDQFGKNVLREIHPHRLGFKGMKERVYEAGSNDNKSELNDLSDLLSSCLNWNLEKRLKPKDALVHKLFTNKPGMAPRTAVAPKLKPALPQIRGGFGGRPK